MIELGGGGGEVGGDGLEFDGEAGLFHAEVRELGVDERGEFVGSFFAGLGEIGADGAELFFEDGELVADGGVVLVLGAEVGDLLADLLAVGEDFVESLGPPTGVLVDEAVDEIEAVVDFGELGGIDVEAIGVAGEGEGGIIEIERGVFDLGGDGGEGFVEFGEFEEEGHDAFEAFDGGAFIFVESGEGGGGGAFDFFEVGEDFVAGGEFFVFAGDELGIIDFLGLEIVEFELLAAEGAGGGEFFLLGEEGLALVEEIGELAAKWGGAAEVIDDGELVGRFEEELGVVLAVDVDEDFADVFEHGAGDGVAVDGGGGAAAAGGFEEAAGDDEFGFLFEGEVGGEGDFLAEVFGGEVEDAGDAAFLGAFAEHVGGRAETEENFQGPDDEGFAGTGLAGEAVEAGVEFDSDVLNDGEVLDMEFAKQGGGLRGSGSV